MTVEQFIAWMSGFAAKVDAEKDVLTALDSAIGDADHGTNLHRGMTAVVAALSSAEPATVAEAAKLVGMKLVSTVGGASGPLYGTFFIRFAQTADFPTAFRSGVEGVAARGKASPGDKTMLDALIPAADALERGASVAEAAGAAAAGRDSTIPLVARKGRASYLGERSAGHQDPGATSAALLVEAAAQALS